MRVVVVETTHGTEIVPTDLVGLTPSPDDLRDYIEGEPDPEIETETGWFSRLSAPGYLDCTDWCGPFASQEEALRELAAHHDVCEHCFDQCWDSDEACKGSA
jgi:hypothetical protein